MAVIMITGSSTGIGRETALHCAQAGHSVIITYNSDPEGGRTTEQLCKDYGAKEVLLIHLNLLDDASIRASVEAVRAQFKKLDILVNNAGIAIWKPFPEQTFADIELQVRLNVEGLMKLTHAFSPLLTGHLINIASGAGLRGFRTLAPYCGTKFAVRGFSQALAKEEPAYHVTVVNPDMTSTRLTDFQGRPVAEVAEVIMGVINGEYTTDPGGDVHVWDKR